VKLDSFPLCYRGHIATSEVNEVGNITLFSLDSRTRWLAEETGIANEMSSAKGIRNSGEYADHRNELGSGDRFAKGNEGKVLAASGLKLRERRCGGNTPRSLELQSGEAQRAFRGEIRLRWIRRWIIS
jgi:hypothetical protein